MLGYFLFLVVIFDKTVVRHDNFIFGCRVVNCSFENLFLFVCDYWIYISDYKVRLQVLFYLKHVIVDYHDKVFLDALLISFISCC